MLILHFSYLFREIKITFIITFSAVFKTSHCKFESGGGKKVTQLSEVTANFLTCLGGDSNLGSEQSVADP